MGFYFIFECQICVDLFSTPLSVQKLAQTNYALTPFNIKGRYERLATAVYVIENRRTSSFNVVVLQMTGKKYTIYIGTFPMVSPPWFAKALYFNPFQQMLSPGCLFTHFTQDPKT